MKKILLIAAALTAFVIARAASPLDIVGVPADVHGVVQIDFSTAQKVQSGIALLDALKKQTALPQTTLNARAGFQRQIGYNPATDLTSVTVGLYKTSRPDDLPDVVAIIRGNFPAEKILALTRQNKIGITSEGPYSVIAASNLGTMLVPELGNTVCARFQYNNLACIVDKNTILFAPTAELLAKLTTAATRRAAVYAAPQRLAFVATQTGSPFMLAHAGGRFAVDDLPFMPDVPGMGESPKASNTFIALGDKASRAQAFASFEYANTDAALKKEGITEILISMLPTVASGGSARTQRIAQILGTAKTTTSGKYMNISLECSVADAQRAVSAQP